MSFFNSRRSPIVARHGAVATSQPLAAQSGLKIMMDGGNAVDAAVAAAATLNVVEPTSTGIGGDMFALIWDTVEKKVVALNGSGRSGSGANVKELKDLGYSDFIPKEGEGCHFSVSVPGTVHGWETALTGYGRMSLNEVLKSAIHYALNGFGVSKIVSNGWENGEEKLTYRPSGLELLPNGKAPRHGDYVKLPELGRSLEIIADGGSEAFYSGDIGKKIVDFIGAEGGWLTQEDLDSHHSDWDNPISTKYRDIDIWECPPNGQGIAALIALNIVEGFDIASMGYQSVEAYHHLIESMRCGFMDALQYVADPRVSEVPIGPLLSKDYASQRRSEIKSDSANPSISYGNPMGGSDTVYVTAVDGDGMACSLINSLYAGFGSGLVVPTTGIALQNRGALFSLDPDHPNYLQPRKRPYQTIIPAMATRDDEMWLSFGVMGGFQQPQGHLQVVSNMVDFNLDSQQALDSLRFKIDVEDTQNVMVEDGLDPNIIRDLERRGHNIMLQTGIERVGMGGGQIISRDPESGVLTAGSEPRKDGAAVGW